MSGKPDANFLQEALEEIRDEDMSHEECAQWVTVIWHLADQTERAILLREILNARGPMVCLSFLKENESLFFADDDQDDFKSRIATVFAQGIKENTKTFGSQVEKFFPECEACHTDLWYMYIATLIELFIPAAKKYLPGKVSHRLVEIARIRSGVDPCAIPVEA